MRERSRRAVRRERGREGERIRIATPLAAPPMDAPLALPLRKTNPARDRMLLLSPGSHAAAGRSNLNGAQLHSLLATSLLHMTSRSRTALSPRLAQLGSLMLTHRKSSLTWSPS